MPTYKHKVGNLGGSYSVDADLDNMQLRIKEVPEVRYNLTHLPRLEFGDINVNANVNADVTTNSDIRIKELPKLVIEANTQSQLNISIKEIPDVRAHVPLHFNLGVSLFGVEIVNFSLCGESQLITEKYQPRASEQCH